MTWDGAVLHLGRSVTNHDHALDGAALPHASLASRSAVHSAGPQVPREFFSKLTTPLQEQRLVDRFVTHVHGHVVRVRAFQVASNLLRGLHVRQVLLHCAFQRNVRKFRAFRSGPTLYRLIICAPSPVRRPATIRVYFASDGGCRSTEVTRNATQRFARLQVATDLFTLGERQVAFGPTLGPAYVLLRPAEESGEELDAALKLRGDLRVLRSSKEHAVRTRSLLISKPSTFPTLPRLRHPRSSQRPEERTTLTERVLRPPLESAMSNLRTPTAVDELEDREMQVTGRPCSA